MRLLPLPRIALLIACGFTACASSPQWFAARAPAAAPEPALVYDPPSELPAPEAVHATSGQYREIPLDWDPVLIPGVAGYLVESSVSATGPFRPRVTLRDRGALAWVDRSAPDSQLGDGAARFYRLRAFAHDGRVSRFASLVAAATTAPLPDPPDGLRAFSRQPRSIPLRWSPSADPIVAGYTVERSPGTDGPFQVVAQLDGRHSTHLLDNGLGDLRVLYYRVSSRNPGGERGAPSHAVRAVTKPAPLPPISLRVAGRRLGAIALTWEPNVEADLLGYQLHRWRDGQAPEMVTYVSATETRAEDVRIAAEETYDYALIAVDRDGLESRASATVRASGLGYEWRASASPTEVRLAWNPRSDEGFVRARVTRSGALWQQSTFLTQSASLRDPGVSPGREYHYQIVLERADGITAPPSPPIAVRVPRVGFVEIQPPASRLPQPEGNPR